MPQATHENYSEQMNEIPLLHTVVFESSNHPNTPIDRGDDLLVAIQGLRTIRGVRSIRAAHTSIDTPNIVEELVLESNQALQELRINPTHDAVVEIARVHTNWKVVDRAIPPEYHDEPQRIHDSKETGNTPLLSHRVLAFHDSTSSSDIEVVLGDLSDSLADVPESMLFSRETSMSLDRRKGNVAIVRTGWHNLEDAKRFATSSQQRKTDAALDELAIQTSATHYI